MARTPNMWVNHAGEQFWVKYHFHTNQGMEFFTNAEAARMAGDDADFHRRDLFDAIARGEHPSWVLSVQVMPYADAKTYRINPFDLTKTWPHADYPLIKVGTMTLNRNPENFFGAGQLLVFRAGDDISVTAPVRARVLLLGGEPMDGPRHVWWNFVSSSQERLDQAKRDWKAGRFAKIPGDDVEFIPLPE